MKSGRSLAAMKGNDMSKVIREGNFLYQLNGKGANLWFCQVSAGFCGNGARTKDDVLEAVAASFEHNAQLTKQLEQARELAQAQHANIERQAKRIEELEKDNKTLSGGIYRMLNETN